MRLNNRAFAILQTEVHKRADKDPLSQIEKDLVLRELELLQKEQGSPASLEELRQVIISTYPNFSEKALKTAVKANQPSSGCRAIALTLATVMLVGTTGAIVLASLIFSKPSPPPITEDHYQEAVTLLEQADKLINQAMTSADVVLGEEKLKEAEKHLAQLPASQTVSTPIYTWRRKKSGRMVKQYVGQHSEQVSNPQFEEIRSRIEQVESQLSQAKQVQVRASKFIQAAKQFAFAAAKLGQNPPHTEDRWQQVESLWKSSLEQLEHIGVEDPAYVEAQKLIATYRTNLGIVQTRLKTERESQYGLERAEKQIQDLIASIPNDGSLVDRNQLISEMQGIINQLQTVKPGTTSYAESQQLMQFAQKKLKQL